MSRRFSKCSENFSLRRVSRFLEQRYLIWQLRLLKNDVLCLFIVLTPLTSSLISSFSNSLSVGWLSSAVSFLSKAVLFYVLFFFFTGSSLQIDAWNIRELQKLMKKPGIEIMAPLKPPTSPKRSNKLQTVLSYLRELLERVIEI